ncbi:MAG: TauD/TfdA family dioxygenase [Novosphingobium sp.]|nr:TauD/TfdA family dioxygenase [Novosphingobium sp.]
MEFRPLHQGFGAEVSGFDVMGSTGPADIAALRAAYDEYQLLVFRCDEDMPPERQVEISGWIGPVMDSFGSQIGFLSNEEGFFGGRERLPWHFDYTFTETPFKGISLQAVALPSAGTTTLFTSNIANWASLPPELQRRVEPLSTRHRDTDDPVSGKAEVMADHPIRMTHPRTGKPQLFVTEYHSTRINELAADESEELLAALFAHMYAPENVHEHRWQLHDFLLWDNWAIQHSRPVEADPADGIRSLRRVTNSDHSYEDIVERARLNTEELRRAEEVG